MLSNPMEAYAPLANIKTDQEILEYVRQSAETDYQPVGSCRMGVDEAAVVDPRLRVRGVEALRVVNSSTHRRAYQCCINHDRREGCRHDSGRPCFGARKGSFEQPFPHYDRHARCLVQHCLQACKSQCGADGSTQLSVLPCVAIALYKRLDSPHFFSAQHVKCLRCGCLQPSSASSLSRHA